MKNNLLLIIVYLKIKIIQHYHHMRINLVRQLLLGLKSFKRLCSFFLSFFNFYLKKTHQITIFIHLLSLISFAIFIFTHLYFFLLLRLANLYFRSFFDYESFLFHVNEYLKAFCYYNF